jgi:branched-subunit amino acid transport protein AzlD
MDPILSPVRKPVQRDGASRYLLFTLLSFAGSVSLTRLFLELTGYPQIGSGTLHIAHVLWGGLLLFIAALLPIMFINRWALLLDAIICGAGVGLFIDEVGKFITRSNDYFYPAAAPIIYAFFLLTVLLYLEFNRPRKRDPRAELYAVLDNLEEVLDQDLSRRERDQILLRLNRLEMETHNPDLTRLIKELKDFVDCDTLYLVSKQPGFVQRGIDRFKAWEDQWVNRRGLQVSLAGALVAAGGWTLRQPLALLFGMNNPVLVRDILTDMTDLGLIQSPAVQAWFDARLVLQASVGIILLVAAAFFVLRKDRHGVTLSYLGLLLSLTMVDLLVFYFNQFSTIITAVYQFCLLLAVLYYRHRYLRNNVTKP